MLELYCGLCRGIQKLKERPDALGPGGFVVLGAFDAFVVQVFAQLPVFFQEQVAEELDVRHRARAFAGADVQPNARAWRRRSSGGEAENHALVPPDGRRESGDSAERLRVFESDI